MIEPVLILVNIDIMLNSKIEYTKTGGVRRYARPTLLV